MRPLAGPRLLAELRRTREQVEHILRVVVGTDGVAVLDFTGRIVYANAHAARILGCTSPEVLLSTPSQDVLARLAMWDEAGAPLPAELPGRAAFHGDAPSERTVRIALPATGEETWVVVRSVPLVDEAQRIVAVVNVFRDITAQKHAEWRLRLLADASAALTRDLRPEAVLEALRGLLVPALGDWCAVETSPGTARLPLLTDAQPQLLETVDDLVLSRLVSTREEREALRALQPHALLVVPLPARALPRGRILVLGGRQRRRYGPSELQLLQEVAMRAGVAFDNAWMHTRALEEDRRKDEFIAVLGHELRNPLHPLFAALELMRTRAGDAAAVARTHDVVHRQARHLARLVDDLLDVSRMVRGKVELRRAPLDLNEVVQRAVESARPQLDGRSHVLRLALTPLPLWVDADAMRLEQVVVNLLHNAAKYTPVGGHISLSTRREGDVVQVRVRDTGVGLAPEDLERIFEPFAQVVDARDLAQGGLGIGLALVRGFVRLHGGTVQAASPGPGQGAEFTVCLPAHAPPSRHPPEVLAPVPPVASPAAPGRAFRVLLVDDNREGGELLGELLQLEGYEVHLAHDAPSALALVERMEFQAALLDIGLPGMDGYTLAQRLRASRQGGTLFLAAVTGYGHASAQERAREVGFDAHFTKPVCTDALLDALADAHRGAPRGAAAPAAAPGRGGEPQ